MKMVLSPEAIRSARDRAGLSLRAAAREIPASKSSIVNWEAGETRPGADLLGRMAAVYGVDVGEFFIAHDAKANGYLAASTPPAVEAAGTRE
jgi:transcriptional regulator with XRE-family HTH domain